MTDDVVIAKDHWSSRTYKFVLSHLERGQQCVDIATGYFTVQGYDLLRPALRGKAVRILVGYDEASKERLLDALIDNLMAHLRRWDAPNRREAVQVLVDMLERGELEVKEESRPDFIESRVRNRDHAKLYIIDNRFALVGSSNLSKSGLLSNDEGMSLVDDEKRVLDWCDWFDAHWNDPATISLTAQLLAALREWLRLDMPFDIYLKTIQALVDEEHIAAPREAYTMPTKYQWIVIKRVLRQLETSRGAMVVASTGLGKTIIATHVAYLLHERKQKIRNVIVFGPKAVLPNWEEVLDNAGLSYRVFVRNLLDQPRKRKGQRLKQVQEMERAMERADEKYLIIIDESQYYANRISARNVERRSFERLQRLIDGRDPYVLLLTATPYSKGVQDINNQLFLLPHTAPAAYKTQTGQLVMSGVGDHKALLNAWHVQEDEGFFDEFMNLPVSTVISTSQVARDFATPTSEGDYVEFPDGSARWIPRIHLRMIKTAVLFEEGMVAALRDGCFRHKVKQFQVRGYWMYSHSIIENQAKSAWASSPVALAEVLRKTISGEYDVEFLVSQPERERILQPILVALEQCTYRDDDKFMELNAQIVAFHDRREKVVIFVERHATAVYLEESLALARPELQVANTVRRIGADYELKQAEEVEDLILDFAPIANDSRRERGRPSRPYDVLIATDAHGVGLNLQDASVAISYDLPWTADPIIQRAGRILRFWHGPRQVNFLVFMPNMRMPSEERDRASDIESRLRTLRARTKAAERFSELPIIPDEEERTYPSLSGLASVTIEDMGTLDSAQIEEFSGVSPFLRHYSNLHDHQQRADELQEDLISALEYDEPHPRLYLLLRVNGDYRWAVYDLIERAFEDIKEDYLLDLIVCEPDTEPAGMGADKIEETAQRCKKLWCETQAMAEPETVERICALYLVPGRGAGLDAMLRRTMRVGDGAR